MDVFRVVAALPVQLYALLVSADGCNGLCLVANQEWILSGSRVLMWTVSITRTHLQQLHKGNKRGHQIMC